MAHPALVSSIQYRLLYLHPGQRADDLSGDVFALDIDPFPAYDALSYAWEGEIEKDTPELPFKRKIRCNEEDLAITANLGRALQILRDEKSTRVLWVDQICINQNDNAEREQQVRCMGDIYRNARTVVVWLGDSDDNTERVWNLMAKLRLGRQFSLLQRSESFQWWAGEGLMNRWIPKGDHKRILPMSSIPPELARLPPANDELWNSVKDFLNRAWFFRTWTLQEVVLSDRCHVMCGEHALLWEDLSAAVVAMTAAALRNRGDYMFLQPALETILLRDTEREKRINGYQTSLRGLLAGTRNLRTLELHDKVFGLLSLVNERLAARLHVRYSRSVPELFGEVARACIEEDKSLAVLAEVGCREHHDLHLASWIPDWRDHPVNAYTFNSWTAPDRLFFSAGTTEPMVSTSDSADTLILRGFLVAKISRILDLDGHLNWKRLKYSQTNLKKNQWRFSERDASYKKTVIALNIPATVARAPHCEDDFSLKAWKRPDPRATAIEMLQTTLRRTMTADLYPRPGGRLTERMLPFHFPVYAAWKQDPMWEAMNRKLPPRQVLWEHERFVQNVMRNRRAFIAGDDYDAYLGIGLNNLQEGDCVCVLFGGNTPFILRPMHPANYNDAAEVEEWSLVSEGYVHGIMDGETMLQISGPKPKFKLKNFVLPSAQSSRFFSSKL